MMRKSKVDAVVIGSGIGGICAAARLVAAGMKVAVVEKSLRLGGRCSHVDRDGFLVTTGATMIPMGEKTAFRQTFDALGVELKVRKLGGGNRYRLPGREYEVPAEGGGLMGMLQFATRDEGKARALHRLFMDALSGWRPLDNISFKEWLEQYTTDEDVHRLYQGFCAAFIGTSANEVPAGEFFRFLHYASRKSVYGIAMEGNGQMVEALAGAVVKRGSEVRRMTSCQRILVEGGRARGVLVSSGAREETIAADFVISDVGPARTVELAGRSAFERSYLALLDRVPHVTPVVHISFATDRPLMGDYAGILNFGNTESLIYFETPSLTCPELAPKGKYLSTTYSVSRDAINPDLHAVTRTALRELEANFPGFARDATILVKARHSGDAPAMRRLPGHTMPVHTSIPNLLNVGDGCMPPGSTGVEACAMTAVLAVEAVNADIEQGRRRQGTTRAAPAA